MSKDKAVKEQPLRGAIIGRVDPYVADLEPFQNYLDRLEAFFELNNTIESEKVSSLTVLIGPVMYGVLKNLVSPRQPKEFSFVELCEQLREHYAPKCIVVAERFKFHCRNQGPSEPVRDFVVSLKNLAATCEYGTFLNDAHETSLSSVCMILSLRSGFWARRI
ncbi:Hypothetical protein NTJ_02567 [Nesidiocoris tenuis]|uniref:Retrotransposon gag domain-containing protein n=1 Tax=Nesidiocoris tenuis TaxID=355587 RepID=A0ABN7ABS3_9HEMI|nr:Hypothetical protein NTJ_02567 [Nesidiocoris tenuis]